MKLDGCGPQTDKPKDLLKGQKMPPPWATEQLTPSDLAFARLTGRTEEEARRSKYERQQLLANGPWKAHVAEVPADPDGYRFHALVLHGDARVIDREGRYKKASDAQSAAEDLCCVYNDVGLKPKSVRERYDYKGVF